MFAVHSSDSPIRTPALICGIPASGKSSYGHWLECEKNVMFVDVEEDDALQSAVVDELWEALLTDVTRAPDVVNVLTHSKRKVVLAWGFPVSCLPVVSALKAAGINSWWFDGDHRAARQSFVHRGEMSVDLFDHQLADIQAYWPDIVAIFGNQIIQVVRPGPAYLPSGEIYLRMFA